MINLWHYVGGMSSEFVDNGPFTLLDMSIGYFDIIVSVRRKLKGRK